VASCGGDHRPDAVTRPDLLELLDQTRAELTETRQQLADSERRAARDRKLALLLQRAIMPSDIRLNNTAGVDIAARCRPASPDSLLAGDWYDVLRLPGGDLLFVVGDVAGHGIGAMAGMVAARNGLRALAVTGASPARLMATLNQTACLFAEGVTGTVICGQYSPRTRMLRWARAGHLPLVLIRDGKGAVQPMPEGMLIGVYPECTYEQRQLQLRGQDTLLFYTDGIIERRAASISEALADFAAAAAPVGPDLDRHVAGILADAASDTGDDACLLAVRIR
jgi:serine phosphatase RsbU (regulator of sigma subunit)